MHFPVSHFIRDTDKPWPLVRNCPLHKYKSTVHTGCICLAVLLCHPHPLGYYWVSLGHLLLTISQPREHPQITLSPLNHPPPEDQLESLLVLTYKSFPLCIRDIFCNLHLIAAHARKCRWQVTCYREAWKEKKASISDVVNKAFTPFDLVTFLTKTSVLLTTDVHKKM